MRTHIIFGIALGFLSLVTAACPKEASIAIGSFTNVSWIPEATGEGLSLLKLTNSSLSRLALVPRESDSENPSYVAVAPPYIYASNTKGIKAPGGAVTRISFSGSAPFIETVQVQSQTPTAVHLSLMPTRTSRRIVLAASFAGFVMSFVSTPRKFVFADKFTVPKELSTQFENPERFPRQSSPHPHQVLPYRKGALVSLVGADMLLYMGVNRRTGKLSEIERVRLQRRDGPRHAVLHPFLDIVYVANEISLTVAVLRKACGKGILSECDRARVGIPSEGDDISLGAIRVSPDGGFLYVSLLHTDKDGLVVAFALNTKTGDIKGKIGEWSTRGIRPRDFNLIGPVQDNGSCRSFIMIANRSSDNLVVLERDAQNGKLGKKVAYFLPIGTPASVEPY